MNAFPTPQRLPNDVLLEIAVVSDQATKLALSSACYSLRDIVARYALKAHPVRLSSLAEIDSFARFVRYTSTSASKPRISFLHSLEISLPTTKLRRVARGLQRILARAKNLKHLTLIRLEPALVADEQHARVLRALTRPQSLRSLTIRRAGLWTVELLKAITSPLERLSITECCTSISITSALDGFLDMRDLTIERCVVPSRESDDDDDDNDNDSDPEIAEFPLVDRLVVPESVADSDADFMEAFPNLRFLDVGTVVTKCEGWSPEHRFIRSTNINSKLELLKNPGLDEDGNMRTYWKTLESVRGGILDLALFGNVSTVRELEIVGQISQGFKLIPAVVGDHSPQILRLSVGDKEDDEEDDEDVDEAEDEDTNEEALQSVQSLTARFVVAPGTVNYDGLVVSQTQLTHLHPCAQPHTEQGR